jgi:hypothetical protein
MTYIKGLSDSELQEFIETTAALSANAVNIGAMHAQMGVTNPRRYPQNIERMERELDIAVAVRRRRVREGRWNPEADYVERHEGYDPGDEVRREGYFPYNPEDDDGYDWDTPYYENGASHGPWDMNA